MEKKRRLKVRPLLITLNILVLFCIIGYYLVRMTYYYLDENGQKVSNKPITLSNAVIKKRTYVDLTEGLVYSEEDNVYAYKGKVEDNYLLYSGILFRIVGVDNGNNVRAVTDESMTLLYSGLEKGFDESYINSWLNKSDKENTGLFRSNLVNADKILTTALTCEDQIDDIKEVTCDKLEQKYEISLLSLKDYSDSGASNGYLNNGELFYLSTTTTTGSNYYVNTEGNIGKNAISTRLFGVRPMITIDSGVRIVSGNGSLNSPYVIETHEIKKLSDVNVGSYVKYSGYDFKVISRGENVELALTSKLKDGVDEVSRVYGGDNAKYTTSDGIGKYLNTTFYDTLTDKDYVVSSKWYIGLNSLSDLNYQTVYSLSVDAKVGMLSLGDLFLDEVENTFTISRGIESSSMVNIINSSKNAYGDLISSKHNVRPALYLKGSIDVKSGEGTKEKPFVIGGAE